MLISFLIYITTLKKNLWNSDDEIIKHNADRLIILNSTTLRLKTTFLFYYVKMDKSLLDKKER